MKKHIGLAITLGLLFSLMLFAQAQATESAQPASAQVLLRPPSSAGVGPATAIELTTLTDRQGHYQFTQVPRASHQVWIETSTLPLSLRPGEAAQPVKLVVLPGQALASDLIGDNVRFTASYDDRQATISGIVFVDRNGDGRQAADEPGLPGVKVIDPGLHQYYIPFSYTDLATMYQSTLACLGQSATGGDLAQTIISLVASGDGTVFYYDQWEDGYDADPTSPGPTTIVGVLNAGQSRIFQNPVNTAGLPANPPVFDGRDRITVVGEEVAVTMAFWLDNPANPNNVGTRLAGAWEVLDVADWGTSYVVPVGEDLGKDTTGPQGGVDWGVFDYVGLEVMAAAPGTAVTVDPDGAGPLPPVTGTLGPGQTLFVPGDAGNNDNPDILPGVYSGATINASAPVQVQVRAGQCTQPFLGFAGRSYTLLPTVRWSNDYWAPSPDWGGALCTTGDGVNHYTDLYIRNQNASAITVHWQSNAGSGDLVVPANSTLSFRNTVGFGTLSAGGLHLTSTADFWAVAVADSANAAGGGGLNYDWSYALIPTRDLASQAILGWSPGAAAPTGISGNLAYVTAAADTRIFVDLNQDGTPDYFDINGDGDTNDTDVAGNPAFDETTSNQGIPLNAGQTLRVADPNPTDTRNAPAYFGNADLNGSRIYTIQLDEHIAVAWGEDPCLTPTGNPYLDLGYTVLPVPIPNLIKTATLAVDADLNGTVSPGDIISYTLILQNNGQGEILNPTLSDVLPFTYTDFVVGSLSVSTPPAGTRYDDGSGDFSYNPVGVPGSPDPAVQAFRLNWPALPAGDSITAAVLLLVQADIPPEVTEIANQARASGDNVPTVFSQDPTNLTPGESQTVTPITQPELRVSKLVNVDTAAPGDVLTYTIVMENVGDGVAVDTRLSDVLPPFQTYIPNSLVLTYPQVVTAVNTTLATTTIIFAGSYADDFDTRDGSGSTGYTGNDGSLAWGNDWQEMGEADGPGLGDVQAGTVGANAYTPPGYLQFTDSDNADDSAWRLADLTDFSAPVLYFYRATNATATDTAESLFVDVSTNGGVNWTQIAAIAPQTDPVYSFQQVDLTPYAGQANFAVRLRGPGALDAGEYIRVDNVSIVDTNPIRTSTTTLVHTTSSLDYSTLGGQNPVSQVDSSLVLTQGVRLPAGGIITATFQVSLTLPLTDELVLSNTADVTASNLITRPFPLTDTASVTIRSSHALQINKTDDHDPARVGDLLTYTMVYTVSGDSPAPNVTITDPVPANTTDPSCSGGLTCGISDGVVTWRLGDLLPAGSGITQTSGIVTLTVLINAMPPDRTLTNTVVISDDNPLTPPASDDELTALVASGFALSKQRISPSPVVAGDPVTFTITITNTGDTVLLTLPLTDTYDTAALLYQGATPLSDDNVNDGQINWSDLTISLGDLAPGQTAIVTTSFTALARPSGYVAVNTAQATASDAGGPLPSLQDSADVAFVGPALGLEKSVDPAGAVVPGGTLTYTLCYSNNGTAPATGVVITDFIPANTTYLANSVTSPNGENVEWYDGAAWQTAEPASVVGLRWLVGTLVPDETHCVSFRVGINMTIVVNGVGNLQYTPQGWGILDSTAPTLSPTPVETPASAPAETATPMIEATPTAESPAPESSTTPVITFTPTVTLTPTVEVSAATNLRLPGRTVPGLAVPAWWQITATVVATHTQTPVETPLPTVAPADVSTAAATETPMPTDIATATATTEAPQPADTSPITPTIETPSSTPTPSMEPAPEASPTEAITPTVGATPVTETPAPTATTPPEAPTATTPSEAPTAVPLTETPTVTPTASVTAEPTPVVTSTPIVTVTATPPVATATPTVTATSAASLEIVPFEEFLVTIVNTATISSDQTPPQHSTVTNTLISRVEPQLTKRSTPSEVQIGDVVTTTITVQNTGNSNATDVVVHDQLPIYLDLMSVTSPRGTVDINFAARVFSVTVPALGPGEEFMITVLTVVNGNASPPPVTIVNNATLTFSEGSPRTSTSIVLVPPPPVPAPPSKPPSTKKKHEAEPTPTPIPTLTPVPTPPPTPTPAVLFLPETGEGGPPADLRWWPLALLVTGLLVGWKIYHRRVQAR
jgi:uncharacterized repeat protein (TIGR01451 family)